MIRRAARADVAAIAQVHVRSRRHGYAELVDPETLASEDPAGFTHTWLERLAEPGVVVLVWDQSGQVAGFASVEDGVLETLYVDPPAQGAGVGSALLEAAVAAGAWRLTVHPGNGHAIGLYERRGWVRTGTEQGVAAELLVFEAP